MLRTDSAVVVCCPQRIRSAHRKTFAGVSELYSLYTWHADLAVPYRHRGRDVPAITDVAAG
jgi:hypothetical protein